MPADTNNLTQTLLNLVEGKVDSKKLFEELYPELREMAHRYMRYENKDHTMQATGLLHEAYVKLVDQSKVDWQGRTHFLAVSAQAMRRILVDHARAKLRNKRGGDKQKVKLDEAWMSMGPEKEEHVLLIEDAIEQLEKLDPIQAQIVVMRFYGGFSMQDVADHLGWSKRKVEAEWTAIKAWLRSVLSELVKQ